MSQDYTVKLSIFEGPLDLLLHLIKSNELEISEISISAITGQYLDTLRLMESLDLDIAGDFLVMAATLLNIKLRALLPVPDEESEDEESEDGDQFMSARALMQQLVEYRKFKEAAQDLGRRADRQAQIFLREVALPKLTEAEADPRIRGDLGRLLEAFSRVLLFVQRRDYHQVQQDEFHVDEKIALLRRRLFVEPRFSLTEMLVQCSAKIEMIVTVIAVLELCRLKELRIAQAGSFGDILVCHRDAAGADLENGDAPTDAATAADELARIEADILANRTGLVDDGVLPDDDEDTLLDKVLGETPAESAPPSPFAPPKPAAGAGASQEDAAGDQNVAGAEGGAESEWGARVIDLTDDEPDPDPAGEGAAQP